MKNIRFIFFLSVLLISNATNAQEIPEAQIAFVNQFIAVVEAHDFEATLNCTDKTYRKEQLKFLEGRKEQFIDELFGGVDIFTEQYVNTRFVNITKIEVAEIVPQENGDFEYIFRIRIEHNDLLKSLLLRKTKNKFGFIGAMG